MVFKKGGNNMFNTINEAIEDIKNGRPIVVVDDEDRENEGDLFIPAEAASEEIINFMIKEARGLMCVPITKERAEKLCLNYMTEDNTDNHGTAFTVSVDSFEGTTTGISVLDRLKTIKDLADDSMKEGSFRKPGHIFPLIAKENGVLERKGHTEAAVDLSRLAGFKEVGVIIEILNDDGKMARRDDLLDFCQNHDLKIITIEDLILYRKVNEKLVKSEVRTKLPTKYGDFEIVAYSDKIEEKEYVVIIKGDIQNKEKISVRLHSECLTGDVFGSKRCDCGEQLERALVEIEERGEGILIYLRQEGRGIGLINKLKAYNLQEQGYDTVEANHQLGFNDDLRDYAVAAQIIKDLGIKSVSIMTNNPLKISGLEKYGIKVLEREELEILSNGIDKEYLKTKKEKMGHIFNQDL